MGLNVNCIFKTWLSKYIYPKTINVASHDRRRGFLHIFPHLYSRKWNAFFCERRHESEKYYGRIVRWNVFYRSEYIVYTVNVTAL